MTSSLLKIRSRPDYVEEVYQALADAICDGSLAPGTRLTQEDIAEQLAVSRSPVLQALRLLKKDGLVQDAPGRGVLVAPLNSDWLSDLYEVRATLDALAARLAATKKARLDPQLFSRGRTAWASGNVRAMIDADMEFHFAVYAASGNQLISDTARVHWVHLRRVMGASLQVSGQRESIWDEHAAIAKAIERGDASLAMSLSDAHAKRAQAHFIDDIDLLLGANNSHEDVRVVDEAFAG
ncbi:GntR family transcriptional regulator [Caballeronia sp. LZ062]|uniref:GntR family transcriptional regulator n=1 Tax=unclassified Caballeronia TaxID=2646786 RepID=UPI00285D203D|nr:MULTISPECIES: GntR family transcriptional regulator [unclassified Caballeronia]MDR5856212.1 GntR family transcriptional regulator [Caballeronia sp. LZ050]MDR5872883.1 GntR family transcriptional regulator [Caballeronia sp. LZ062]